MGRIQSFSKRAYMLVQQPSYESSKVLLLYDESQKLGSIGKEDKILFKLK